MYGQTTLPVRLVATAFRMRALFLIAVPVLAAMSAGLLFFHSKTYIATSFMHVGADVAPIPGISDPGNPWGPSPAQLNVQRFRDYVNDDQPGGFLDTALKDAKLSPPINLDPNALDARYGILRKYLSADSPSPTTFTISLVWPKPDECERVLSALCDEYIERVGREKQAKALATEAFLTTQIQQYERRMRGAEQTLLKYRTGDWGQLSESGNSSLRTLEALRKELASLQITMQEDGLRRAAIKVRMSQVRPTSVFEQTLAESPLLRRIKELKAERDVQSVQYLPGSDEIKSIDAQLQVLEKSLARENTQKAEGPAGVMETKLRSNPEYGRLAEQLTGLEIADKSQSARMGLLKEQIASQEERVRQFPLAQRAMNDHTRDYGILNKEYESLLARREQTQLAGNLDRVAARSEFHKVGVVHAIPTSGRMKRLMMAAAACIGGLLLCCALVVLRELTDPVLRYAEDGERSLGVPVLGGIPQVQAWAEPRSGNKALPGGGTGRLRRGRLAAGGEADLEQWA